LSWTIIYNLLNRTKHSPPGLSYCYLYALQLKKELLITSRTCKQLKKSRVYEDLFRRSNTDRQAWQPPVVGSIADGQSATRFGTQTDTVCLFLQRLARKPAGARNGN